MCESMHLVLASILDCSRDNRSVSAAAGNFGTVDNALCRLDSRDSMSSMSSMSSTSSHFLEDSPEEIREALYQVTHEIQDLNHRMLERYLLRYDGLPLTSVSQSNNEIVQRLRECLLDLNQKMRIADENLKALCTRCDAWYNVPYSPSAVQRWKANYDGIRDDIQEVHAAVDQFSRHVNEADAFLHQQSASSGSLQLKRIRSLSPDFQHKRLKQN